VETFWIWGAPQADVAKQIPMIESHASRMRLRQDLHHDASIRTVDLSCSALLLDEQPASNQRVYTIDFSSDLVSYLLYCRFYGLLARLIDTKWNDEHHYTLLVIFEDFPADLMVVTCGKEGSKGR
jgi:hypothetical protein